MKKILFSLLLGTIIINAQESKKPGSLMQSVKKVPVSKLEVGKEEAENKIKAAPEVEEITAKDEADKKPEAKEVVEKPKEAAEPAVKAPVLITKEAEKESVVKEDVETKEVSPVAKPKLKIEVTDRTKPEAPPVVHISPAEEKEVKEALKGPVKPVTPAEKAEAGIIEEKKKAEAEKPVAPVAPKDVDIKKEAVEKEKVDLELTPPECLPSELDTTGIDAGGNWVIKRAFWEQAEKVYEKIMKANNGLYDQQVKFVKSRGEIDKTSDAAFRELGFEQGKLAELLENLIEEVKEQREQEGDLDEKEREFLQTLKQKQNDLEQLKLNLKAVGELEDSLNKVMSNLNQQVSACRKYEKQAWEHFKSIGKELNDKKARLLFYEMEGFLKTVEKNRDYVTKDLWNYFNDSIEQVKDHLKKIEDEVDQLQKKGTDFTKEFERFEKADKEKDEKEIEAEKEQVKKELEAIEKKKKELEQGIWGQIKSWARKTINGVKTSASAAYKMSVAWVTKMFGGIKKMIGMKK